MCIRDSLFQELVPPTAKNRPPNPPQAGREGLDHSAGAHCFLTGGMRSPALQSKSPRGTDSANREAWPPTRA
eukprot:11804052-Alexandrium_andersonii.AAC.1